MADLIERLGTAINSNSIGYGKIVVQRDLLEDALDLLKQYSGLTKALEQSNAVNEHLNAEIERLKEMQRVDNCERCRFKDKCLTGRQLSR